MVALALGLVMIGAVVTVFVSNQQSARTKQELDRAQEAFRFASHTIMRVVQQGEIQPPDSPEELLVVDISPEPGHRDCLGRSFHEITGIDHARNTFFIDAAGSLLCQVENHMLDGSISQSLPEVIVTGIDSDRTEFTFGVSDSENAANSYWSNNAQWVLPPGIPPINWANVRSVRVRLAMQSGDEAIGPTALFSATMRCGGLDSC